MALEEHGCEYHESANDQIHDDLRSSSDPEHLCTLAQSLGNTSATSTPMATARAPVSPFSRTQAAVLQSSSATARASSSYFGKNIRVTETEEEDGLEQKRRTSGLPLNKNTRDGVDMVQDIPALITPKEIQGSLDSYDRVLHAAAKYREALSQVSSAAAEFGEALEECSKCVGAGDSSDGLLAAGGLHYLISNHEQILANSIRESFEEPVTEQLDLLAQSWSKNEREFKNKVKTKTKQLKTQQRASQKLARTRGIQHLGQYRNALQELTAHIDDIDRLQRDHFASAFSLAETTSNKILDHASAIVQAEVTIYEGIARKGWAGGGLDGLIPTTCFDPFAKQEQEPHQEINGIVTERLVTDGKPQHRTEVIPDDDDDDNDDDPNISPIASLLPSPQLSKMPISDHFPEIQSQQSKTPLKPEYIGMSPLASSSLNGDNDDNG